MMAAPAPRFFSKKAAGVPAAMLTNRVLLNIKSLVEEAGMTLANVVKCSIFLKNMDDFSVVNTVYASYFSENPPARETVQVAKLPLDVPIEFSSIAIAD
jgi:2-iminobutanoate/2-iminopropanoate deaminase